MSRPFRVNTIQLGSDIELRMGSAAPDAGAGVAAPIGSSYWRTSTFEIWQKVGAANTAWVFVTSRDLFGNGSDGDVVIGAGTTSLARDMYYNTLTIQTGGILRNRGFRIFVRAQLIIDAGGSLQENGGDGGATGTAGLGGGLQGTVQDTAAAGGTGSTGAGSAGFPKLNAIFGATGVGGAGGAGSGGAGGAAGTLSIRATNVQGNPRALVAQSLGTQVGGNSMGRVPGGTGGGAGGGNGAAAGGGGGGAGGVVHAVARHIVNNGTIQAHGGAGGNAANVDGGGGGGGGGGVVLLGFHHLDGNVPTVTGGAGGTGNGAGVNGAAGASGNYIPLAL